MKKRPSRVWLFFWGRKRRGYPGLLTAIVALAVLGALTIRFRPAYDVGYWLGIALVVLLAAITAGALLLAVVAALWPRGRR